MYGFAWSDSIKFSVKANPSLLISLHLVPLKSIEIDADHFILEYANPGLHNLHDLLLYSPRSVDSCEKVLFVLYQLLSITRLLHAANLNLGELRLSDVYLDETCWIRLRPPLKSMLDLYKIGGEDTGIDEDRDDIDNEGSDIETVI